MFKKFKSGNKVDYSRRKFLGDAGKVAGVAAAAALVGKSAVDALPLKPKIQPPIWAADPFAFNDLKLGPYSLFLDPDENLRIKLGHPANSYDGAIVEKT